MAPSPTTAPPGASNGELIRWSFGVLNTRDVSALRQLWTEATVERFPDETCRGLFAHWRLTGTHNGPLLGIAPTGKPIAIDGMDHFVFAGGKVSSNFVVLDQMQYARQIGMMPPDGSLADKALKTAFNLRLKLARGLGPRPEAR